MTGCGVGAATADATSCRVEVRTVNNRGFKFSIRTRDGLFGLETRIEAIVRSRIHRGTVSVSLDFKGGATAATKRLDLDQLAVYLDDVEQFAASRGLALPQNLEGLLGLSGVVTDAVHGEDMVEQVWPVVSKAVSGALDACDAMRDAEGASLAGDLRTILADIRKIMDGIRCRVPLAVERHRARLMERVTALLGEHAGSLTEADLTRELVLLADRSDVAEEIVRLESHLDQFERLLNDPSPGRQLDFLAQELAREANTVASKSSDVEIAHAVVEAKTLIERLREQVQNLE